MKWKVAIEVLRLGEKITRPNWEAEHFWVMSEDKSERILCHNGDHARVHLQQIEADDWEVWREPITQERIEKRINEFISRNGNNPNIIKFGDKGEDFLFIGMKLYGMDVRVDDSLASGEFEIGYEKPEEKSLSDKEWSSCCSCCFRKHDDPGYAEADLKYHVMRLYDYINSGRWAMENNGSMCGNLLGKIKKEFGEKLCLR